MKTVHYLNLTNGIDFIPELSSKNFDYKFVRIQSSLCERHCFNQLLQDLDYNFLFDIALRK